MSISSLKNRSVFERTKIFEHKLLPSVNLERVDVNGMRHYKTPDGIFPSVTTVLSNIDKLSLENWKKLVGQAEADRIKNTSATRGTELHSVAEKYMLNESWHGTFMPMTKILFKSIQPTLDEVETVYGIELPLYSKDLRTAGTTDQLCVFRGKNTVIDLKTASKTKSEKHLTSYYFQSTAYAIMAESLFGINFEQIVLVIAVEHDFPQIVVEDSHKYRAEVKEFFNTHSK